MQTVEANAVTCEVRIAARPETIFPFLTDPVQMMRWMGRQVSFSPLPGQPFRIEINDKDAAGGELVEIVPHERVVFTWGWEGDNHPIPPGSSTVEISLIPDSDGTIVRLIHRDLPADAVADHTHGWTHYLDRLAIVAAGGDPGPDPMANPATTK